MDFAQQQRNPAKHIAGITFVILLHIAIVYALLTGLARKVVAVIQQPIETKIIKEVKPPPPDIPPLPPPPVLVAPPPPFIPPPEVQIQVPPPPPQNVITAVTPTPPPVEAPPAVVPRVVEAPPAPAPVVAAPPSTVASVVCPNIKTVSAQVDYPAKARRLGLDSGEVAIEFVVGPNGAVKSLTVLKSSNRVFNEAAEATVQLLKCIGQGQDIRVQTTIGFKLQ